MLTRTRTAALLAVAALAVAALPVALASPAAAAQTPTSCPATTSILNGGFEEPVMPPNTYVLVDDADVPGWQTSAPDHLMEFWGSGWSGVPAAEGNAFVELNANTVSTLFQDVATVPGTTLHWSLQHRGRLGIDVMRVLIGDTAGPLTQSGSDVEDDNLAWGAHDGSYLVPAGQTSTRFAFESVSATGGVGSYGNFLDDVSFGTAPCLITDLAVTNLAHRRPALGGDTLRYTVTVTNDGGVGSLSTRVSDLLADDVAFVPGSLVITSGVGAGALTDAAGDDAGEFDPATGRVRVRLGTGADATDGGSIAVGASVTFRFDVLVMSSSTARTTNNTATTRFGDPISLSTRTSTSQTRAFPVAASLAATGGGGSSPVLVPLALLLIAAGALLVARTRPRRV